VGQGPPYDPEKRWDKAHPTVTSRISAVLRYIYANMHFWHISTERRTIRLAFLSALSPRPSALPTSPLIPARPCGSFHAMAPTPSQATLPEAAASPGVEPSRVAEFEHSLDELEQLVQRMEHGDLSLDDSLKTYERGIALYRNCQTALEQAELRVKLLYDPETPDEAEDFKPDTP